VKKIVVLIAVAVTAATALSFAGATGASGAVGSSVHSGGAPMIRAHVGQGQYHAGLPTIALNWSGYASEAKAGQKYNFVSSEFIQPTVDCSAGIRYANTSNWVGLDGFENGTVEQDGTAGYCAGPGHKTAFYYAWIELFPLPEVIAFKVKPGDLISALVKSSDQGKFTLTVTDLTSGKTKTQVASCTKCERSSAEWIIERPAYCTNDQFTDCFITPLANFGTTTMTENVGGLQGQSPVGLGSMPNASQIFMIQTTKSGGFYSLVNVSPVDATGNAFSEQFLKPGKPVPIQL
jgi:Peptidase A4 family